MLFQQPVDLNLDEQHKWSHSLMDGLRTAELPYPQDVAALFAGIANRPWAIWLDSGSLPGVWSNYDILVCDPYASLITEQGVSSFHAADTSWQSRDDPFSLLRTLLHSAQCPIAEPGIPFAGGAVGVFAYDLARCIETLPQHATDDLQTPQLMLGLYDWAVVIDHHERRCRLASWQTHPETAGKWDDLIALFSSPPARAGHATLQACGALQSNLDYPAYRHAFARIQQWLRDGDCYQVNFAQRFTVPVKGDPFTAYCRLREQSPAPFGAYLNTSFGQILGNSPERFLRVHDGQVETCPIKGTRPRAADPQDDQRLYEALQQSSKDRAENVMIVDLLRNDLSKSCRKGSVKVPELFRVESFATVHHLISRVVGELEADQDAVSLLRHCFPGGSITGAPKRRAVEIIEALGPHRRGIYCGAVAYLGFDGNMDSNIAIRTTLHRQGRLYYSAGGGIVSDSLCEEEYRETFHKAAAFFRLLEIPADC